MGLPDRIVCSTAARTRETLQLASSDWPDDYEVEYSDRIYAAPAQDLIKVAGEAPSDCHVQLLVSHNPGCADAVLTLAEGVGPLAAAVQEKFPTSAVAVLQVPEWQRLRAGSGSLIDFAVPRA